MCISMCISMCIYTSMYVHIHLCIPLCMYVSQVICNGYNISVNATAHLYMDRDIKVFNRPIVQKIQKKNQELHLQRLRNIKSGSSSSKRASASFASSLTAHSKISNRKMILMEEEKKTAIEKQNVLLFNRMMRIMKRDDCNQPKSNHLPTHISRINQTTVENSRISQENKCILERLSQQKPTISHKRQHEDRVKNLGILKFLGKYPHPVLRTSYESQGFNNRSESQGFNNRPLDDSRKKINTTHENSAQSQHRFDDEAYDEEIRRYQQQVEKIKERDYQSASKRRRFMSQGVRRKPKASEEDEEIGLSTNNLVDQPEQNLQANNCVLDTSQIVQNQELSHNQIKLYEGQSTIHGQTAKVKFVRTQNSYIVQAEFETTVCGQTVHELYIPEEDGNEFFSQENYDYKGICNMLILEQGRLVIHVSKGTQNSLQHNLNDNIKLHWDYQGSYPQQSQPQQSQPQQIQASSDNQLQNSNRQSQKMATWTKYEQALEEQIE